MKEISKDGSEPKPVPKMDVYLQNWEIDDCRKCHSCRTKRRLFMLFLEFRAHKCQSKSCVPPITEKLIAKSKKEPTTPSRKRKVTNDASEQVDLEEKLNKPIKIKAKKPKTVATPLNTEP